MYKLRNVSCMNSISDSNVFEPFFQTIILRSGIVSQNDIGFQQLQNCFLGHAKSWMAFYCVRSLWNLILLIVSRVSTSMLRSMHSGHFFFNLYWVAQCILLRMLGKNGWVLGRPAQHSPPTFITRQFDPAGFKRSFKNSTLPFYSLVKQHTNKNKKYIFCSPSYHSTALYWKVSCVTSDSFL